MNLIFFFLICVCYAWRADEDLELYVLEVIEPGQAISVLLKTNPVLYPCWAKNWTYFKPNPVLSAIPHHTAMK